MFHIVSRYRRDSQRTRRATLRVEQLEVRSLLSVGYSLAPVAMTGNAAPGPEGGVFTFDFELGGLNNKGQVVFTADLDEGAGDAGEGVFLAGKGGTSQIIRVGESAPGGGTFGGFGSFSPDTLNDSGDAAFGFGLDPYTPPLGVNAGVYRYDHENGKVTAVLVPGVTAVPGGSSGETFAGTTFNPSLNNGGVLAFPGTVAASVGPGAAAGLGEGIFLADNHGHLTKVVRPGDPAPGGHTFDYAVKPAINDRGDIAFDAHITSDPLLPGPSLPDSIFTYESVYLKDGETGAIRSVAHQGAAIPASAGGGTFEMAYAPVLNSRGQVLFDAGIHGTTAPFAPVSQGIFLDTNGKLIAIARQGDSLPGGGHLVSVSFNPGNFDLNNSGDVAFNALLDTGAEGVYLWSHGALTLVAKTGTVIPGVGTIASLDEYGTGLPNGSVYLNERGQLAFAATLEGGGVALLVATPGGKGNGDSPAVSSAAAVAAGDVNELSEISAALVLVGHGTSDSTGTDATSKPRQGMGPR